MENVHNIFEELVKNISVKRETPQKTTPEQPKANEDGIAETMDVNRAANILQKGTRVCVKKAFCFKSLASLYKQNWRHPVYKLIKANTSFSTVPVSYRMWFGFALHVL